MFKWLKSEKINKVDNDPDPADISVNNAYKTRWIWYHTILALELLMTNVLLAAILTALVIKL
jgi:hypothetical protein